MPPARYGLLNMPNVPLTRMQSRNRKLRAPHVMTLSAALHPSTALFTWGRWPLSCAPSRKQILRAPCRVTLNTALWWLLAGPVHAQQIVVGPTTISAHSCARAVPSHVWPEAQETPAPLLGHLAPSLNPKFPELIAIGHSMANLPTTWAGLNMWGQ